MPLDSFPIPFLYQPDHRAGAIFGLVALAAAWILIESVVLYTSSRRRAR